jgi:hypothetical protein
MACHLAFFLNSWRAYEILGKIPMSKFHLNLLVKISKLCKNPNSKKNSKGFYFLNFGPAPVFSPTVATSLPSQLACSPPPH